MIIVVEALCCVGIEFVYDPLVTDEFNNINRLLKVTKYLMNRFSLFAASAVCVASVAASEPAGHFIILHTNDTHSRIDPDASGRGGVLRRQALIDSVRNAEANVLLVDAGDAVQGTLYYSLFGGEVERKMMNALGYDIQILGNHEFDNGMEALAREWGQLKASRLTTNYDLTDTPLDSMFKPYEIRTVGDRRIAFIAINIDPDGMISAFNSRGVKYLDGIKAANATAWHLKHNEKVDMVVALTHIGHAVAPGYTDMDLARNSEDIDLIIGGHSHTLVNPSDPESPAWFALNANGDSVIIAQAGSTGAYVGKADIDLADLKVTTSVIPVDSRLDDRVKPAVAEILEPYRSTVDSILSIPVAEASAPLRKADWGLVNLISDLVMEIGTRLNGAPVDMAIMNRGGIRCDLDSGTITKGAVMQMLPFDNHVVVIDVTGADLLQAFEVMAGRKGDGISGAMAEIDPLTLTCREVLVNGRKIDPLRRYKVATIDYLALGGDFLSSLKNATIEKRSEALLYDDVIGLLAGKSRLGKKIVPDTAVRMPIGDKQ